MYGCFLRQPYLNKKTENNGLMFYLTSLRRKSGSEKNPVLKTVSGDMSSPAVFGCITYTSLFAMQGISLDLEVCVRAGNKCKQSDMKD